LPPHTFIHQGQQGMVFCFYLLNVGFMAHYPFNS
jgi:hypothetical protein